MFVSSTFIIFYLVYPFFTGSFYQLFFLFLLTKTLSINIFSGQSTNQKFKHKEDVVGHLVLLNLIYLMYVATVNRMS